MPMSQEDFANCLANQQPELTVPEPIEKQLPKKKSSLAILIYLVPCFVVIGLTLFFLQNDSTMKQSTRTATWDNILGTTAKVTGRKYDSNAESLTERFTLKKKKNR